MGLSQDQRQQVRRMLESPGWLLVEQDLLGLWESSVSRLIQSNDDDLKVRQAEVRMLEKIIQRPNELLKTRMQED